MAKAQKSRIAPRKAPRQSRSHSTVEVILEAAARVLATESLSGFNTNRVAEVAGISIGSLYQYFPNKAALTAALIERAQSALIERVQAVIHQPVASLHEHVARLVEVGIHNQFGKSTLAAALDHEESRLQTHPEMAATLGSAQQQLLDLVMQLLRQHASDITATIHEQSAADMLVIAKSLIETEAAQRSTPSPALAARVERAILGYLCC